jgi:hypothetical protein
VKERGARVTCIIVTTPREDGWQGRKGALETFGSFLKSMGVFGFGNLA